MRFTLTITIVFAFLLSLFTNEIVAQTGAQAICSAFYHHDTLVVKNDRIALYYNVADGNIKFSGYALSGKQKVVFENPLPDLKILSSASILSKPVLNTAINRKFTGENEFLEISLAFNIGKLEVKRIWEIYPGLASISTYYLFKGVAGDSWLQNADASSSELIEDSALLGASAKTPYFGVVPLKEPHWKAKVITFIDATDHHNNLINEDPFLPYLKSSAYAGNLLLLRNEQSDNGVFVLKEAPLGKSQQAYPGFDFIVDSKKVLLTGVGVSSSDILPNQWIKSYAYTLGFSTADETDQLTTLHLWQKNIRLQKSERDEMLMSNTWGDRSKDGKMNEKFIIRELEAAAKLGITHFQLDDGWQQGLSKNSADKSGLRWNNWTVTDWKPHQTRFPNGFEPIVAKAKEVGIELGLWFNPGSGDNYNNWQMSADILLDYYKKYNIRVFKIDGVVLASKESEINLGKFFQYVTDATNGNVVFNLDVTAGKRGGYHFFNQYGNIFLENRYTDWANYYPDYTLRNLWQLSKYMPVEKLQAEWLSPWRNRDKYPAGDELAPANMSLDYLMATTFIAQPLAWMEISALPPEAFAYAQVLRKYKAIQHDLHQGVILPLGDMPDGHSWSGFQSLNWRKGYFLIFREKSSLNQTWITTYLKPGLRVKLTALLGQGKSFKTRVNKNGQIRFKLPSTFNYALYSYELY